MGWVYLVIVSGSVITWILKLSTSFQIKKLLCYTRTEVMIHNHKYSIYTYLQRRVIFRNHLQRLINIMQIEKKRGLRQKWCKTPSEKCVVIKSATIGWWRRSPIRILVSLNYLEHKMSIHHIPNWNICM